jgi:cyclophilin family peptidyl-prolyl cis-trans isomerase
VAKSASPRNQRVKDSERQRLAEEARARAYERAVRRRRMIGIGVVVVVVAAVFGAIALATGEKSAKTAATTTLPTVEPTTTVFTGNPGPPASLPTVPPGASITGDTPCPKADGSSPRTTTFEKAPPVCIDLTKGYDAVIATTKGNMKIRLEGTISPQSVNNFIVLARYHYYDGLPITRIVNRGWAEVADPRSPDGKSGPGYRIAGEAPKQGSIPSPLIVATVPDATGTAGGAFLFGIADQAAGMPKEATQIGQIMDSRIDQSEGGDLNKTVQQEINKAGTQSGAPAEVITITSITVSPEGN